MKRAFESVVGSPKWISDVNLPVDWEPFFNLLKRYDLEASDCFLRHGEPTLLAGFVTKGYIRSYYPSAEGEENIRNFSGPGDYVGPIVAVLQGSHSDVSVEALTSASILGVPYSQFVLLYEFHPFWDRIGRRLVERFYLIRERHAMELLTMSASERLQSFMTAHPQLAKHIPRKHLASYLGIRPETLTRLMKDKS